MKKFPLAIALTISLAACCLGQQRLFVVGGGERPAAGMSRFVEWSGGPRSRILAITWASGVPDESFEALKKGFMERGAGSVEHAATRPLDPDKRARFLDQIKNATAIFFSGGDQNRIMDVLADSELLKLLRDKYKSGIPFGGTSAGAAVMSDPMMTGDADLKILDGSRVGTRAGLGLVPNVIFDQHFLVRQRHNRLLGLIMTAPTSLGIGIDEDTAVLISDNKHLEVVGATYVMFVDGRKRDGSLLVNFLKPGERFNLASRKREGAPRVRAPAAVAGDRR